MRFQSLAGMKFGRLTAISRSPNRGRKTCWLCVCDCGSEDAYEAEKLKNGNTQSCGCLRAEMRALANTTHGKTMTKAYESWASMIQRCTNPKKKQFANYGGRGIKVCDRWLKFENFLADMGECPSGKSLDRINNDGDYEPGNCRWATRKEQMRNRRNNVWCDLNGVRMVRKDVRRLLGISERQADKYRVLRDAS